MSISNILNNDNHLEAITKVAFKALDTDGSGTLEREELEVIMKLVA